MRDYGKVYTKFWESEDIRALSDDGRLLALYLMTCMHGTIAGVFRLPDGYVCEDMKWSAEKVAAGFAELLAKGFANRCETSKWVWVRKHLEWNPPENPNQRKAAVKVALSVAAGCGWKQEFMRVCGPSLGIEAPDYPNPPETLGEGLPNQKQEQKQEQEQKHSDPNGSGAAAAPPAADVDMTASESRKTASWRAGKSLLHAHGMPKDQTGTFLGKLHTDCGSTDVFLSIVEQAVAERPAEPEAWMRAACQRVTGQRKAPEPAWRAEQRERTQLAAPGVAVGSAPASKFFIDVDARPVDVPALAGAAQ
jgi:hypothetical protein